MADAGDVAKAVGLALLDRAIDALPELGTALAKLLEGAPADLPLLEELRTILPVDGASARARRELLRGGGGGGGPDVQG